VTFCAMLTVVDRCVEWSQLIERCCPPEEAAQPLKPDAAQRAEAASQGCIQVAKFASQWPKGQRLIVE